MNKLIDIHTHILPDIDGGAESLEEAKAMVRSSYEGRVRTIVTTPHFGGYICRTEDGQMGIRDKEHMEKRTEEIRAAYDLLCEACKDMPDLTIVPGSEIYCSLPVAEKIIALLKEGLALTINGTCNVLIEFSYSVPYGDIVSVIEKFAHAGYRVILAHVEKYECLYGDSDRIRELIDHGAIIQMNAEHLNDQWCLNLVADGLVHVLGSDCHNQTDREPNLAYGMKLIREKLGDAKADQLQDNAMKILWPKPSEKGD